MKPDKRQMKLFADAPNRMEIKDHRKKETTRAPKRKGFTSSADVHIGEEVDIEVSPGLFHPAWVRAKETDTSGSTAFHVITEGLRTEHKLRLGELYRRMK